MYRHCRRCRLFRPPPAPLELGAVVSATSAATDTAETTAATATIVRSPYRFRRRRRRRPLQALSEIVECSDRDGAASHQITGALRISARQTDTLAYKTTTETALGRKPGRAG